jgi:GNAT superfamily N-acetyltransferase
MPVEFKAAPPDLSAEYIRLRGLTRENAVTEDRLRSLGITAETWANHILSEELKGFIAEADQDIVGYCFGDVESGEVVVLAVRPAFEFQGIGQRLLALVVDQLRQRGHTKLFLGCSADPTVRSHGFYRHLGWRSTGTVDERGDEILELLLP